MSDTIVGLLGLVTIVAVVVTLFKSKTQPAIAFIIFPAILGLVLVLGGRIDFSNLTAMIKAGVELAFETMCSVGIKPMSAYYESLHETPLIANLIARKKLYEMNRVISDTAEYGCYLFANKCVPLLADFMKNEVKKDDIGAIYGEGKSTAVDNEELIKVNKNIRQHPVEEVGAWLRERMSGMTRVV